MRLIIPDNQGSCLGVGETLDFGGGPVSFTEEKMGRRSATGAPAGHISREGPLRMALARVIFPNHPLSGTRRLTNGSDSFRDTRW